MRSVLNAIVEAPMAQAVGFMLLHSLWQGFVLASLLGAVMMSTRSARIRYVASLFALLCLLGGCAVTLVNLWPGHPVAAAAILRPEWHGFRRVVEGELRTGDVGAWVPWFTPAWLCGVCVFYLRYAAGLVAVHRLRGSGATPVTGVWRQTPTRLAAEVGTSRPVMLLESMFTDTPIVWGHLRPVILVPLGFLAGLPPEQVEVILLHELAHVIRHDYLLNLCERLLAGLFFYHPAVWWMSRVVRVERENCCDDLVLGWRCDPRGYAIALSALERNREEHWAAAASSGGKLMDRITRILQVKRSSGPWAPIMAALILAVGAGGAVAAWHVSPEMAAAKTQTTWDRWLNEDVVYIIADAERAAFERLRTEDERQHFVDQFWERRNPSPRSTENAFKEEHYRRLAYANQHYLAGSKAGWQTDRGRIYITDGPPDEIEAHPSASPGVPAHEEWRYRDGVNGSEGSIFSFIDRGGTGDYRLVLTPE